MKTNNRILLFGLFAIATSFIPYYIVRKGLSLFYEGSTIEKVVKCNVDVDIAVFGSSVAWAHFDPQIIESETKLTSYNFGLNGSSYIQYKGLLEEYLTYSEGEMIVLASTTNEFTNRESIFEFYKYYDWIHKKNICENLSEIDPQLVWRSRFIPLYNAVTFDREVYKQSLLGYFGKTYIKQNKEVKGYSPKYKKWEARQSDAIFIAEIDKDVLAKYKKTIMTANMKGKKVVLVLTPIYIEGQKRIANLNRLRELYKLLAGKKNIFLDFTRSRLCNDKDLFYNNTHLNANGAKLFSQEFSRELLLHL